MIRLLQLSAIALSAMLAFGCAQGESHEGRRVVADAVERQSRPTSTTGAASIWQRHVLGSISISLPLGWERAKPEPDAAPENATFMRTDAAGNREILAIVVVDLPDEMRTATVAEFAKWAWLQIPLVHLNAKLEESQPARFAGGDGWRWRYTVEQDGQFVRALQVFNVWDGKSCSIAYLVPADTSGASEALLAAIVDSVRTDR